MSAPEFLFYFKFLDAIRWRKTDLEVKKSLKFFNMYTLKMYYSILQDIAK